jgi:hypothetical protein
MLTDSSEVTFSKWNYGSVRRGFGFLQLEMKGNLSFATLHSVDAHSLRNLEEFRPEKPDGFEILLHMGNLQYVFTSSSRASASDAGR